MTDYPIPGPVAEDYVTLDAAVAGLKDQVQGGLNTAYAAGLADQTLADEEALSTAQSTILANQTSILNLQGRLEDMTSQRDAVQMAFDQWVKDHTVVTPPPVTKTAFGFNIWASWDGYSRPGAAETSAQLFARLKRQGYPAFKWAKVFYSSGSTYNLPATWAKSTQGELDPTCPASNFVVCWLWAPGTLADKSHDAQLTAYCRSAAAAGKRVILTRNEPDNNKLTAAQWPLYVADMNHLYDLVESLNLGGAIEVRDCFMNYSLQPASGPAWKDSWTNPSKRHGIIFDAYNNQAHVDSTGATTVKQITDMLAHLGFTPDQCIIGEYGNRRPNDANTPAGIKLADSTVTDASRAAQMKVQYGALIAAEFEAIIAFDVEGSSGDHRYLDIDTASRAALASIMSAA